MVFDKTPPADGAWLVKNSWGAGTEVFPNKGAGKWGIENAEGIHTGYFWISYYDQSLLSAGSFIFEEGDSDDIITQQYDYMPEILAMGARTQDETRMGNVFCARESMKREAEVFLRLHRRSGRARGLHIQRQCQKTADERGAL